MPGSGRPPNSWTLRDLSKHSHAPSEPNPLTESPPEFPFYAPGGHRTQMPKAESKRK